MHRLYSLSAAICGVAVLGVVAFSMAMQIAPSKSLSSCSDRDTKVEVTAHARSTAYILEFCKNNPRGVERFSLPDTWGEIGIEHDDLGRLYVLQIERDIGAFGILRRYAAHSQDSVHIADTPRAILID